MGVSTNVLSSVRVAPRSQTLMNITARPFVPYAFRIDRANAACVFSKPDVVVLFTLSFARFRILSQPIGKRGSGSLNMEISLPCTCVCVCVT